MKIAFVVQRYGMEINGGAELHCRWIAEHMKKYYEVEVLTTKAYDYITWENYYLDDIEEINGVLVRRFPVARPRNPMRFGRIQQFVFHHEHKIDDELKWLEEEGPLAPALIKYIDQHRADYDYFIFFSYRYYHSYWGIQTVPEKSILVPTAEHDPVVYLRIFKELFSLPRAFIYNSEEEKNMIQRVANNSHILGKVVGVGIEIPSSWPTQQVLEQRGIASDYLVYIGRIDENKGCDKLFQYFLKFKERTNYPVKLVLVGSTKLTIPHHPDLIYLGFVSEEEKFAILQGALLLIMPSFYESLSMVTLEAWALEKPVLANAHCEVLQGQCQRSQGGLYYENYAEFEETLKLLLEDDKLREILSQNGRRYFESNYTWEVIEQKYNYIISKLEEEKENK
ncbi:MAG TPA: glycosyltransferase family 1 protein [Candidatus Aminicenantes bacterium]|nr:glycosyltransferase family 1 protein [Candidatus Aminicenantes bacterium]